MPRWCARRISLPKTYTSMYCNFMGFSRELGNMLYRDYARMIFPNSLPTAVWTSVYEVDTYHQGVTICRWALESPTPPNCESSRATPFLLLYVLQNGLPKNHYWASQRSKGCCRRPDPSRSDFPPQCQVATMLAVHTQMVHADKLYT